MKWLVCVVFAAMSGGCSLVHQETSESRPVGAETEPDTKTSDSPPDPGYDGIVEVKEDRFRKTKFVQLAGIELDAGRGQTVRMYAIFDRNGATVGFHTVHSRLSWLESQRIELLLDGEPMTPETVLHKLDTSVSGAGIGEWLRGQFSNQQLLAIAAASEVEVRLGGREELRFRERQRLAFRAGVELAASKLPKTD